MSRMTGHHKAVCNTKKLSYVTGQRQKSCLKVLRLISKLVRKLEFVVEQVLVNQRLR